jgi:hypothetical protein
MAHLLPCAVINDGHALGNLAAPCAALVLGCTMCSCQHEWWSGALSDRRADAALTITRAETEAAVLPACMPRAVRLYSGNSPALFLRLPNILVKICKPGWLAGLLIDLYV